MTTVAEIFEAMPTIFNSAAAAGLTKTFQWNITWRASRGLGF